jgi:predicted nucleic acid-binding protein
MGANYLIDTNIAIYLLNGSLNQNALHFMEPIINDAYNLSVITKIELLGFAFPDTDKLSDTKSFINDGFLITLNDDIVEQTITLRQLYKIKMPDAIIAATAIVFDYILLSRNDKDFTQIVDLKYINPFLEKNH